MWFSVHSVTGCKKTDFVNDTTQLTRFKTHILGLINHM